MIWVCVIVVILGCIIDVSLVVGLIVFVWLFCSIYYLYGYNDLVVCLCFAILVCWLLCFCVWITL